MATPILDQYGRPYRSDDQQFQAKIAVLQQRFNSLKAKYDAAQTWSGNENHWANADSLDPHSANSLRIRQLLRSRSRYELVENNPYLNGTVLSLCNDFVGSGPRLRITDPRISVDRRKQIKDNWDAWASSVKLRQKLWRLLMAKIVDGEGFFFAYDNRRLLQEVPFTLDFHVTECDRVSSWDIMPPQKARYNQIDGLRFDNYDNPLQYHRLYMHPGSNLVTKIMSQKQGGEWVDERYVVHWFDQPRSWLRGVPVLTPSLPLCALLRRYTLAVVRAAELAADFSAVLESELPPGVSPWTDGKGNLNTDLLFDVFPIEMGMITMMPYGTKMNQFRPEQPIATYDVFVASILREIIRPLLVPYNRAAGTSQDSNMASSVVDDELYKNGQKSRRLHCGESVLDKIFRLWWQEYMAVDELVNDRTVKDAAMLENPTLRSRPPKHLWRWDRVGNDHTDPEKVARALQTAHDSGFITDQWIQDTYYNREYEDWQEEMLEAVEFRRANELPITSKDTAALEPEPPEPAPTQE